MVRLLARLYPNTRRGADPNNPAIEPLRPDLLGEELVDHTLSGSPALLGAALADAPKPALTVLTRLAKRKPAAMRWLKQAFEPDLKDWAGPASWVALTTGAPMGEALARFCAALAGHCHRRWHGAERAINQGRRAHRWAAAVAEGCAHLRGV